MASNSITCPNCGEKHNASGDYTSPANRDNDRRWRAEEHESGRCAIGATSTQYKPGELRIVRDVHVQISANVAYHVEEVAGEHHRLTDKPLTEKDALLLMRELGSPYPGQRYDDAPFARKTIAANSTVPPTNEQRFNMVTDQLIAATGSPGLTSFHDGKIHMTLEEWERLVSSITAAQETTTTQTKEMHSRELHHFEEEQISASVRAVLDEVRRLCGCVEYRVPGKHNTWDAYHEGRSALADDVEALLDRHARTALPAFARDRISEAMNRAADDIIELAPEADQIRDSANLIVNAALHYLENPGSTLQEAIEANYNEAVADVLEWAQG